MSENYLVTCYTNRPRAASGSRADERYNIAVGRNIDSRLLTCREYNHYFYFPLPQLLSSLDLERISKKLGIRTEDKSWGQEVQNLRCAMLAAWVLLRHPPSDESTRGWLACKEFAAMDGGERMLWLRRYQIGLEVIKGVVPQSLDYSVYNWK